MIDLRKFMPKSMIFLLILLAIAFIIMIYSFPATTKIEVEGNNIRTTAEYAYFSGQKDALEGIIRIKREGDCYVWTMSPWDSGKEAVYQPDCIEGE